MRFIVSPAPGFSDAAIQSMATTLGIGLHRLNLVPGFSVEVPDDAGPEFLKVWNELERRGARIREAVVFELPRPGVAPAPLPATVPGGSAGPSAFDLLDLNGVALTGRGVTVGMIDGEVVDHDRLESAIRNRRRVVPNSLGAPTLVATDGTQNGTEAHGDFVAGIICGRDRHGKRIGVAREADLDIVSINGVKILEDDLDQVLAQLAKTCRVINISVATYKPTPQWNDAIAKLRREHNTLVVGGIGNAGQGIAEWPGACEHVISVGMVGMDLSIDRESGSTLFGRPYRPRVPLLAAPGVDVESIDVFNDTRPDSGTSFASPYIAGMVALMLEACPGATADQIDAALIASAKMRPQFRGRCAYGVPSARKAIAAVRKAAKC